jgi:pimeloyl-ACP methyl ester carboxylesterase
MNSADPVEALTQEILIRVGNRYAAMHVRIWRPSAPPRATVFCLHDFTGNGADFDYLAAFLCRNEFLVICPDMLGRGRSAYLSAGSEYNMNLYYKCLRALGEFAGKQNHFIGSSWGGIILLLFLYMTRTRAAKVVLNDVPMLGGSNVDRIRGEIIDDSKVTFSTRTDAEGYVASKCLGGSVEAAVFKRYVENRIISSPDGYRLAYDPAATDNFGAMMGRKYDLFAVSAKIDARFLFVYGRESRFIDRPAIEQTRVSRPDLWFVDNLDAGQPPSLMSLDQALLILGFLTAV